MRLKSLELKGFKSFANDTLIHFDEDVIGIVGPNGSGKSNIVDAIRWVLGEQKGKELRLENMGDVLFNGTKTRKPSPVATVAITFDNHLGILPSEYSEVVVSRVLYRSGESEYKLNGVTCRLKDIHSLLIDTGIGSNSYAIIALGMVDDILYDKDDARRRMFEQAAGISKFKKRKHETMLKLKLTTDDLIRIEDILKEIETNLQELEKQARRTKRYVDLKQNYKTLSLGLAHRNNRELREQFDASAKKIQDETDAYTRMEADLDLLHAQIEKLKKDHLGDEQHVSAIQKELNELITGIRAAEHDKNLAEQKASFLRQNQHNLDLQIKNADTRLQQLQSELQHLHERQAERQQIANQHREHLSQAESTRDDLHRQFASLLENRETENRHQQEYEKAIFDLEKEMAILSNNRDLLQKENRILAEQLAKSASDISNLQQQLNDAENRRAHAANELSAMEEAEQQRHKQIRELETELSTRLDELRQIQRTLDARTHEAELLKDMISNLEGFPESIKFLSKTEDWKVKAPLLSEIIYCDQAYRVIVEQILEPYLNYYVVNDWDEAARAIKLLRFAQKGRANFFISSEYRDAPTTDDRPGMAPLLNYLEIQPGYESLVKTLLQNVYITDGSPLEVEDQQQSLKGLTLIDREAQMLRKPGQLAGGSIGLFEGKKLGRKKHLEYLDQEIISLRQHWADMQAGVKAAQNRLAELQTVDRAEALQTLRSNVVNAMQTCAELTSRINHLSGKHEDDQNRIQQNESAIHDIHHRLEDLGNQLTGKHTQLESSTAALAETDEQHHQSQLQFQQAERRVNELKLEEVHLLNQVESLNREIQYQEEQIRQLQSSAADHKTQIETESRELEEIIRRIQQFTDQLAQDYETKKAKEAKLTEAEQHYYEQRNTISGLDDQIRIAEKQKNNQQYLINELKENHHNVKFRLMSISERLEVEFGVRLEDIQADPAIEEEPLEELESRLLRYRSRLENYGEINPMAIEAHQEMQARYDSINLQKEDILQAKESLLATIEEIESTATDQFMEAFNKVRENFIDVFRSLFTDDDTCDLILIDPNNPLESAIDIIAKPKGKRPKSLSQLSGGEKTLTAIALLFALYLLKPAPFCVFDEVDAPLDDANIQKFNKIIHKFSAQSQFVIVTHNKSTMAAVDTIYGVYMEEPGISGLSQVDFRAFDQQDMLVAQN